jgi:four helix bundle protein
LNLRETGVGERKNHKDLILWQKAVELAREVHALSLSFPRHEIFGLTSQVRRAAVSVASNTAEGAARRTTKDFIAFLHIARGSLAELETQMILAVQFQYVRSGDLAPVMARIDEVGRLLNGVIKGLNRRMNASSPSPTP